jgi:preprotein translocase SecE subunit
VARRDRKRARDRRAQAPRRGEEDGVIRAELDEDAETPTPLGHLGDAELAAAQLAVGRPELTDDELLEDDGPGGSAPDELQEDVPVAGRETRRQRRLAQMREREAAGGTEAGSEAAAGVYPDETKAAAPERGPSGNRVIAFLGASWRELQRVQWPDRQQVAQATGVVLVFVVIAGLYLGLTGEIASRIVQALL